VDRTTSRHSTLHGLLEPGARKRARPGSEGGPAQQCAGPTRPLRQPGLAGIEQAFTRCELLLTEWQSERLVARRDICVAARPKRQLRARSPVLVLVLRVRQCRSSARSLQATTNRAVSKHEAQPNETRLAFAGRSGAGKRARRLTVAIAAERHSRRRTPRLLPRFVQPGRDSPDGAAAAQPGLSVVMEQERTLSAARTGRWAFRR
jgi:hypothetical protein